MATDPRQEPAFGQGTSGLHSSGGQGGEIPGMGSDEILFEPGGRVYFVEAFWLLLRFKSNVEIQGWGPPYVRAGKASLGRQRAFLVLFSPGKKEQLKLKAKFA